MNQWLLVLAYKFSATAMESVYAVYTIWFTQHRADTPELPQLHIAIYMFTTLDFYFSEEYNTCHSLLNMNHRCVGSATEKVTLYSQSPDSGK